MRKSVYRSRRHLMPKVPSSRREPITQLIEASVATTKGEISSFCDERREIILFTCKTNLECIKQLLLG